MGVKKAANEIAGKILEGNDKIDAKVDGVIDEAKGSRFSSLILGGCGVLLLVIIVALAVN